MLSWEPGEKIVVTSTPVATGIPETNEWEVVERGKIKVLQCDKHFGSYLDIGKEYKLFRHGDPGLFLDVWEIEIEDTNRPESSSQVLLFDYKGKGETPSMEIDF